MSTFGQKPYCCPWVASGRLRTCQFSCLGEVVATIYHFVLIFALTSLLHEIQSNNFIPQLQKVMNSSVLLRGQHPCHTSSSLCSNSGERINLQSRRMDTLPHLAQGTQPRSSTSHKDKPAQLGRSTYKSLHPQISPSKPNHVDASPPQSKTPLLFLRFFLL